MMAKRLLDLLVGIPASIVLTPVILMTALLALATSGWPPLIVQERVGESERLFKMLKVRTMRRGVPTVSKADLVQSGLSRNRDVYTAIGPFMRRWSLDELPQIYNVVLGSMSLVGPRPALPSQRDLIVLRRSCGVTALKPGLTGLAQIRGREALTLATKVRFEQHYLRHRSVWLDLRLMIATGRALFVRRGAF